MREIPSRPPSPSRAPRAGSSGSPWSDPIVIESRGSACRMRLWTEAEWRALPAPLRPREAVRLPGLGGWLAPVPIPRAARPAPASARRG